MTDDTPRRRPTKPDAIRLLGRVTRLSAEHERDRLTVEPSGGTAGTRQGDTHVHARLVGQIEMLIDDAQDDDVRRLFDRTVEVLVRPLGADGRETA